MIKRIIAEQPQFVAAFRAQSLVEYLWRCSSLSEEHTLAVMQPLASMTSAKREGLTSHPLPEDQCWVAGVPFPFLGNALLVGIDRLDGDIATRPP